MKQYHAYFEGSADFYGDVMGVMNDSGNRVEAEFHYDEVFDMDQFINVEDLRGALETELGYEVECSSYYDLNDEERQALLSVSEHDFSDVEGFGFSQNEEIKILKDEILENVADDEDFDTESVKKALRTL
jgi:hypothetical protein